MLTENTTMWYFQSMMNLQKGIHNILILVMILALAWVGSVQGSTPACSPECLHCKAETIMDCCPELLPEPCHGGEPQKGIEAVGCGILKGCSTFDGNTGALIPANVMPDTSDTLMQYPEFFLPPARSTGENIPVAARPPPAASPLYILNCSFLN